MAQKDFEGKVYRKSFKLIDQIMTLSRPPSRMSAKTRPAITSGMSGTARPVVFDLTKLIVGAQGTLRLCDGHQFRPGAQPARIPACWCFYARHRSPRRNHPESAEAQAGDIRNLRRCHTVAVNTIYAQLLAYDWAGNDLYNCLFSLIPDGFSCCEGIPKLILMVEFNGDTEEEVRAKSQSPARRARQAPRSLRN